MSEPKPVAQVSPRDLLREMEAGSEMLLLDVREDLERSICRINAGPSVVDIHIPMGQIPVRLDEIEDSAGARPVIVYCHHGTRSMMVARWLAARGFRCGNLNGGIDAWSTEADPTVARY